MNLLQDLRFAVRLLVKDRWFTGGRGDRAGARHRRQHHGVHVRQRRADPRPAVRRPRPHHVDRHARRRAIAIAVCPIPDFQDWRAAARSFSALAAFNGATMNVSDEGRAAGTVQRSVHFGERVQADRPAAAARPRLPARGRQAGRDRRRHSRQRHLEEPLRQRSRRSIGRTIKVNDVPSTVIGVMPEGFKFPTNADLWLPLALMPNLTEQKRDARNLQAFGRLAPGVTLAQARAELDDHRRPASRTTIPTPTRTSRRR